MRYTATDQIASMDSEVKELNTKLQSANDQVAKYPECPQSETISFTLVFESLYLHHPVHTDGGSQSQYCF